MPIARKSLATFSILAVGSFPQTTKGFISNGVKKNFQYPRCWIVSSDPDLGTEDNEDFIFQYPRCWIVSSDAGWRLRGRRRSGLSVSSLLDRFLRHLSGAVLFGAYLSFQYPRCWIVSSDISPASVVPSQHNLSVSSLLDRFLRLCFWYLADSSI